jgi:hypothetical protein
VGGFEGGTLQPLFFFLSSFLVLTSVYLLVVGVEIIVALDHSQ